MSKKNIDIIHGENPKKKYRDNSLPESDKIYLSTPYFPADMYKLAMKLMFCPFIAKFLFWTSILKEMLPVGPDI
jgi:hypothetical protein